MAFDIQGDWLVKDGRRVDFVESIFIGAGFAEAPRIAVAHFTFGGSARSSAEWFRSRKNPGSSAHFVVGRDGHVIQCVPLTRVAWHAGKSRWRDLNGLNQHSFGIELANWGYLKRTSDGWSSHTGQAIADPHIAVHRNGNPDGTRTPIGWEPYPDVQLRTGMDLVRTLVRELGVNEVVGHDDIAPTRKWDPGPAFDMARFRAGVFGGRGDDGDVRLRVHVASGLNLRSGPGTQYSALENLPAGSLLEPIGAEGAWFEVSVLDASGAPRATGWVHGRYVMED